MPYIQAKLTVSLTDEQKNNLQNKLLNVLVANTGKPKNFVMTSIEDSQQIWMSDNKLAKAAYIAISLLGNITKQTCGVITSEICEILSNDYNIDGKNVYISYHCVDLWGWNGQMF